MPYNLRSFHPVRSACHIFVGASLACAAMASAAEVRLDLRAAGGPSPYPELSESAAVSLERSLNDGTATAYAMGNLSDGVLRASVLSSADAGGVASSAQGVLADSLRLSGSGTAFLDWSFDGGFTFADNKPFANAAYGFLILYVATPQGVIQESHALHTNCLSVLSATSCLQAGSINISGSMAVPVMDGQYSVQLAVQTGASLGDSADFSNTARFFLRLPDGSTLDSNSGVFLATAAPIPAVPEPASVLLFAAGVGAVRMWMRRRTAA